METHHQADSRTHTSSLLGAFLSPKFRSLAFGLGLLTSQAQAQNEPSDPPRAESVLALPRANLFPSLGKERPLQSGIGKIEYDIAGVPFYVDIYQAFGQASDNENAVQFQFIGPLVLHCDDAGYIAAPIIPTDDGKARVMLEINIAPDYYDYRAKQLEWLAGKRQLPGQEKIVFPFELESMYVCAIDLSAAGDTVLQSKTSLGLDGATMIPILFDAADVADAQNFVEKIRAGLVVLYPFYELRTTTTQWAKVAGLASQTVINDLKNKLNAEQGRGEDSPIFKWELDEALRRAQSTYGIHIKYSDFGARELRELAFETAWYAQIETVVSGAEIESFLHKDSWAQGAVLAALTRATESFKREVNSSTGSYTRGTSEAAASQDGKGKNRSEGGGIGGGVSYGPASVSGGYSKVKTEFDLTGSALEKRYLEHVQNTGGITLEKTDTAQEYKIVGIRSTSLKDLENQGASAGRSLVEVALGESRAYFAGNMITPRFTENTVKRGIEVRRDLERQKVREGYSQQEMLGLFAERIEAMRTLQLKIEAVQVKIDSFKAVMDPFLTTETANFYRRYSEFTTPLPPPIAELAPGKPLLDSISSRFAATLNSPDPDAAREIVVDAATNEVLDLEQRFAQYVNNAFAHITTVYVYWKGDGTSDGPANVEISTRFGPDGAAPAGSSHESRTIKNKWDSELKIDSAYRNLKADIEAWEKRPALK